MTNTSRMGRYRRWQLRVSVHESAEGRFRSTVELWAPGQDAGSRSPLRLDGGSGASLGEAHASAAKRAEAWIDAQPEP
jgi:hypothetical protein